MVRSNPLRRVFHTTKPSGSIIYEPLDKQKREIRLLEIISDREPPICKLRTVSLDDNPTYAALSYVWGDATIKEDIVVNGSTVQITTNLKAALKHVQKYWKKVFPGRRSSTMRLWADAICINQSDLDERSHQVTMMKEIYASTELVMAWLGSEDKQVPQALRALNTMANEFRNAGWNVETLSDLRWLTKIPPLLKVGKDTPPRQETWDALSFLNGLPYWRRVWTFQEQALAPALMLLCPSAFVDGFEIFKTCLTLSALRQRPLTKPEFVLEETWFYIAPFRQRDVNQVGSVQKVAQLCNLARSPQPSAEDNRKLDRLEAEKLMTMMSFPFKATDPKDHIYGVLGLLGPKLAGKLTVDYSPKTSIQDVFVQYTSLLMEESQRLEIPPLQFLYVAGDGGIQSDLKIPTWVPNFPAVSDQKRPPKWEKYDSFYRPKNTSAIQPSIRESALSLTGVLSSRVSKLGPTMDPFICEANKPLILELLNEDQTKHQNLQELFRAVMMIQNRDYKCDVETYGLASEFVYHLQQLFGESCPPYISAMADEFTLLADSFPPEFEFTEDIMTQWGLQAEQLGLSMASRLMIQQPLRVFQTDDGHLAIGFEGIQVGDAVYSLEGFPSFAILRSIGSEYNFIGPCNTVQDLGPSTGELLLPMANQPAQLEIV